MLESTFRKFAGLFEFPYFFKKFSTGYQHLVKKSFLTDIKKKPI